MLYTNTGSTIHYGLGTWVQAWYKTVGAMQAEELKAYSQKRMKELEKEIQDCEAAKVRCYYAA